MSGHGRRVRGQLCWDRASGPAKTILPSPWSRLKRDVKFALRERFGRDKTVFQTAWLYGYDVGRELR